MKVIQAKKQLYDGKELTKNEAMSLLEAELEELCAAANEVREHFMGNGFDLCTIVNGKSGKCSENCKYCAQSACYPTEMEGYPLMGTTELCRQAKMNYEKGVPRFSVVTSGRMLTEGETGRICQSYRAMKDASGVSLCASHGLLSFRQLKQLKDAGVRRYHNNLETSRRFFPRVCTTHTYEDKIRTIRDAQRAGLSVCSGGIIGLGETMEDRIDMALELRTLGITSVPINILTPIQGTPFEGLPVLKEEEIRRVVALYRFLLPQAALRLAGGRGLLEDKGERLWQSGANAAITGDMLTTSGISVAEDLRMLNELGFEVKRL